MKIDSALQQSIERVMSPSYKPMEAKKLSYWDQLRENRGIAIQLIGNVQTAVLSRTRTRVQNKVMNEQLTDPALKCALGDWEKVKTHRDWQSINGAIAQAKNTFFMKHWQPQNANDVLTEAKKVCEAFWKAYEQIT